MYTPKPFAIDDASSLSFIRAYPFASITTNQPLQATHVPLTLTENAENQLLLEGHVAKANAHHKVFDGREVLCIFTGPHAYISGLDYEKGPVVPTWNYTAVHVSGTIQRIPEDQNRQVALRMLSAYEADHKEHSEVYSDDYIDKLSKAIVSFHISVNQVQGKFKLGQNRSQADQLKTRQRLANSGNFDDQALAQFIAQYQN